MTTLVLLTTMVIGSEIASAVAFGFGHLVPLSWRGWVQLAVACTAVALELVGVRPLSLRRQVPQFWGHRHGALAAALRYGLRLGVGPSTILTSWLWWSGFLVAAMEPRGVALLCAVAFPLGRLVPMIAVAAGSPVGETMAMRIRWLDSVREGVRRSVLAAGVLALALAVGLG